ncbi:MAG: formyltransferase family protein, partial [Bacteroidia bacterium]|nr:formyltransferase family protein [Bacteroidia bacterium]
MINLAIFASGNGSNAQALIEHFSASGNIKVQMIVCNKEQAYVLERAKKFNIRAFVLSKEQLCADSPTELFNLLDENKINYIILAGYLLKVPSSLINKYTHRIINIHPSLRPKLGGKGMYGMNIHRAVVDAKEEKTGITIHLIDEIYDNGEVLFQ